MMQGECQQLVANLPVSHQSQIFGTARQQGVEVALPKYLTYGESIFLNLSSRNGTMSSPYLLATEWQCVFLPLFSYSFTPCLLIVVQSSEGFYPANESGVTAHTECLGYLTAPDNTRFISSPYDVWAAASAIDNMCVRNGKTGMAKVTGKILLALQWNRCGEWELNSMNWCRNYPGFAVVGPY